MANTTLTADIIAKEAVMILDNNLVMAKQVFRGYEEDFAKRVNGYKIGDTLTIRKPADFTVRDGAAMNVQDVIEGTTQITVNKRKGVDFQFTSQDLTLKIDQLSERVIKPAMVQLANQIDRDLMGLYASVPSWVGTPGQVVKSYKDFAQAPERLDEGAVPTDERSAVLSPTDHWGLLGSQTALFIQDAARGAYRQGSLGMIGGVDTYMDQNVPTHTVGAYGGTPLVAGAGQVSTYDNVKDSNTQSLNTDGWTASISGLLRAGDIFTIAGVFAVNPVTKATLPYLREFVVVSDASSDGSGAAALVISPAIITSGAFQTVSAAPADNAAITVKGTASTGYRQNMVFHKNAFSLVMVDLQEPPGAVEVGRQSYQGCRVRVIPVYDGIQDISKWRLDVLYGVKAIDPRLATRLSGLPIV
ncbi:P22 phage major capsid protein family protein [Mesorhizobium sp. BAC0120]|uniref:P22 phage major capsid protein family protein n=1 Tax=Mesorhizobium sp. BAC0120 TaxID=3090670 RepID=UPI00298CB1E4|nr:P22 phage major capsid protein family protein [Mesorhizobium sp. BAC0120]MDW6020244.1 P22 phage major capsid protein family protein [Mesorhizobium sp. BAC0120]